jgi:serine phosphatase RsbU (regulator of sigma subunit)
VCSSDLREQKAAIDTQKQEIEKTHEQLSEHHKKLSDSITYAQRLQRAILPSAMEVSQHIKENFILFKPKDVVSGDFYWFEHTEGTSYIAAADCTGHGVPGAFMSMIGASLLNEAVNEKQIYQPGLILDEVRRGIINSLQQSADKNHTLHMRLLHIFCS